ncbi:hypothetical protein M5689_002927 [Euphorbia peplus]|nr:hypothetical protein M5689_002927 [Euphorbia peplus]
MDKLPEADVKVQTIEAVRLPASSYRMRGHTYAKLQPFEVWDDNDHNGNNQLNWTNLFLLKKLGHRTLSSADISAITELASLTVTDESSLKAVKALGNKMSDEFADIKKQILGIKTWSPADFEKIKESVNEVLKESDVGARVSILEAKVDRVEKLLTKLCLHLGVK